jgi:uncharacterized integral membrane protein
MTWAVRFGIAGILWAILTFVFFAPHDCATNDLCGSVFELLNYPIFVIFSHEAPANLLHAVLADAATGLAFGVLIDFVRLYEHRSRKER